MKNKNIWLIQTDQPTIIHFDHTGFFTSVNFQESKTINSCVRGVNAYITKQDEDIKENDFVITKDGRLIQVTYLLSKELEGASKVVLSTDKAIIESSDVYLILNRFLDWFVNKANDSGKPIDFVQVNKTPLISNNGRALYGYRYEAIIPDEDSKQELPKKQLSVRLENSLKEFNLSLEEAIDLEPSKLKQIGFGNRSIIELKDLKQEPKKELERRITIAHVGKQEMIEEVAEKWFENNKYKSDYPRCKQSFIDGYNLAQQQNKNLYSEEDLKQSFFSGCQSERQIKPRVKCWEEFIEQFKKK